MTQGRAIRKHVLVWTAAAVALAAAPQATWSTPPAHANNDKQKDGTSHPGRGRGHQSDPTTDPTSDSTTDPTTDPTSDPTSEPANSPPTISGVPDSTVMQDAYYEFQPAADDPDHDTLSFGITNQPSFLSFDTTSGRLSGFPHSGDVGLHGGIVIEVNDGQATSELPAFSIEVMAYANGTATLSWVAPIENTDGSPLVNLAGYEINWGPESGRYAYSVEIMNPGITTYLIENLTAGTHYFAVRAINAEGMASDFSNEGVATLAPE
jgi:hypothetical protein